MIPKKMISVEADGDLTSLLPPPGKRFGDLVSVRRPFNLDSTFKGRTFANWRKWYLCDGGWKPSREGCIIPLERLQEFQTSLTAYCEAKGLRGA